MRHAVAILTLCVCHSFAHAYSGNELLQDCEKTNHYSAGYCTGYVWGVSEGITQNWTLLVLYASKYPEQRTTVPNMTYCLPQGVTVSQMQSVVVKYLRDNPAHRHALAAGLVQTALTEAFPCQQTRP